MAKICAKPARILFLFSKYSPMCFVLGFPSQVLDLPFEGRQTIIPGPETSVFMIQIDLKGFSNSSGTTSHAPSAARDHLLGRFMNKMGNRWKKF